MMPPAVESPPKVPYLIPLVLVTSLFFLWGLAHSLLDVLNKHFQEVLHVSKAKSGMLQFVVFGAYFLAAIPAGWFLKKAGYKNGIIAGLLLYAIGAFLFYPASLAHSFTFFLGALFVIASGLTLLETAANPYVTILGPQETSEARLNLSQSFNGLGWVLGPLLGGLLIFSEDATPGSADLSSVQLPYIIIGGVVLLVAALFKFTSLPEITEESHEVSFAGKGLLRKSHFSHGVIAQFFYVGAQVAIGSFFINYATEVLPDLSNQHAAFYLSGSMFLFTIGRFFGTFLMRFARPQILLALFAACNILLMGVVMAGQGEISVYALMASNFFMSIMFPTIFALSLKNLGEQTKQGASFLIMSVVGGALLPPVMGFLADKLGTEISFSVPLVCFVIVLSFATKGYKIK